MSTVSELGLQIAARRRELNLTQAELGERAGIRQEEISRLERGQLPGLTLVRLQKVARVLGLTVSLQPGNLRSPTLEDVLNEVRAGSNQGPASR